MQRPIAVVFTLDPGKFPGYEDKLPDLLSELIEQKLEELHPGAVDTKWLRCFQFPESMKADDVEDILEAEAAPWKDEAWRGANGTYMERLCFETGTLEQDWEYFNGPETGVGVEYWLVHKKRRTEAYVCIDQDEITIQLEEAHAADHP